MEIPSHKGLFSFPRHLKCTGYKYYPFKMTASDHLTVNQDSSKNHRQLFRPHLGSVVYIHWLPIYRTTVPHPKLNYGHLASLV